MSRTFDYDNNTRTFIGGAVLSWLCVFGSLLIAAYDPGEAWIALLLCPLGAGAGIFWLLVWRRRKTHPHRIVLDEESIEVPSSRFSNEHTRIPFPYLDTMVLKELGMGYHVLDLHYRGRAFRIAENVFDRREDFQAIVTALRERIK